MKCIVTDYAAKEYWKESEKPLEKVEDCMHVINLYPQITGQTIQGFGGAFTEASVHNYSRMSRKKQEEILKAYFSEEGLRYNMGRTHINSCDFGLGNYAYVEAGDDRLETFSIAHDEAQDSVLAKAREAIEGKVTGNIVKEIYVPGRIVNIVVK